MGRGGIVGKSDGSAPVSVVNICSMSLLVVNMLPVSWWAGHVHGYLDRVVGSYRHRLACVEISFQSAPSLKISFHHGKQERIRTRYGTLRHIDEADSLMRFLWHYTLRAHLLTAVHCGSRLSPRCCSPAAARGTDYEFAPSS
jgi:hypothetical protein